MFKKILSIRQQDDTIVLLYGIVTSIVFLLIHLAYENLDH